MKRITLWFLSTLSALVLLFGYHTSTSSSLASASGTVSSSTAGTPRGPTGSSSSPAGSGSGGSGADDGSSTPGSSTPGSGSAGSSATSTIRGSVVSTEWGPVQVQLTLRGDSVSDVAVLQYPNGNPRDSEINDYALPILIDETKQSDSAQIDMVSGATVTSNGYIESLQSALDKAGA
jgi:hypothetical protein